MITMNFNCKVKEILWNWQNNVSLLSERVTGRKRLRYFVMVFCSMLATRLHSFRHATSEGRQIFHLCLTKGIETLSFPVPLSRACLTRDKWKSHRRNKFDKQGHLTMTRLFQGSMETGLRNEEVEELPIMWCQTLVFSVEQCTCWPSLQNLND